MINKINNYLKRQIYNKNFSGCSYYFLCNNEEYSDCFGKNKINDIINVGNFTNILVINVIVSILIDEGELQLYDKVKDYIPEFKYDDILIFHLLTHSSGLVKNFNNKKYDTATDVIIDDINYKILIMIIEKIYITNLDLLARSLIFDRLCMNDTKMVRNKIYTTINDISHFVKMILNNGYYNGKQFLNIKYIDMWFTPLFISNNNTRMTIGWLLGEGSKLCNRVDCGLNTIIFDNGNYILIDRDNDLAIVFLFKNLNKNTNINKYLYKILKEYKKIY